MKSLLALLLLAGHLGAVCGPTDVNAWDFNGNLLSRCSGGEALAETGSTSFGAVACGGSQGATTFEDLNHPKAGAATLAAMQGMAVGTAAGYVYTPSSLANGPSILEFYQSGVLNIWIQILNNGAIRVGKNAAPITNGDTAGGVAATSTCYYMAFVWGTGTQFKLSWSPATAIDNTFDINTQAGTGGALPAAMTAINFGMLDLSAAKNLGNGFLYGWRFRNVAESSFPLTDPSGDLSPYQWNSNSPNMFPNQLPLLLKLFLMPRNLPALEADSRPVATAVTMQAVRSRLEYTEKLLSEGRITRTRTPTAGPSPTPALGSKTPTPTSTHTPDSTRLAPSVTPAAARER